MDQRCTVEQKGYTGRRSLEEGAVDKLLVGELGVEGVQQEGGQQDRLILPLPKSQPLPQIILSNLKTSFSIFLQSIRVNIEKPALDPSKDPTHNDHLFKMIPLG